VITGASSGLGVVFARKLAPEHDLLLIARRKERLEALAAELKRTLRMRSCCVAADLSAAKTWARLPDLIGAEEKSWPAGE